MKQEKKYCSKCKTTEGEFVKSAKGSKGQQYHNCRECNRKRVKKYRQTDTGKLRTYIAVRKSTLKFYEKQLARYAVYNALQSGVLKKPKKCPKCQSSKDIQGHHADYENPLKVKWMCRSCHANLHKKEKALV